MYIFDCNLAFLLITEKYPQNHPPYTLTQVAAKEIIADLTLQQVTTTRSPIKISAFWLLEIWRILGLIAPTLNGTDPGIPIGEQSETAEGIFWNTAQKGKGHGCNGYVFGWMITSNLQSERYSVASPKKLNILEYSAPACHWKKPS